MLTYPEVGATRAAVLPPGYHHAFRDVPLGSGPAVFRRVADGLSGWDVHRGAGLGVRALAPAAPGVEVTLRFVTVRIPCRVVYTVEEEDCRGFAYGTLPGHPEQGEEVFLVTMSADGEVRFQIRAFSRAASMLARCGGPLTRQVQRYVTDRYVRAAREIAG